MASKVEQIEQAQGQQGPPKNLKAGPAPALTSLAARKTLSQEPTPASYLLKIIPGPGLAAAFLGCALVLWWISLPAIDYRHITDYGLIASLPVTFFGAVGLLTLGFYFLLRRSNPSKLWLLLFTTALIFVLHGTTALVYETPRYSWTYKHIGVAAYIQANGSVNPAIDIYHNWPGFFALSAFFSDLAGFASALDYAAWAQVFFNLLYLGPLLMIFKALSENWRLQWLSLWFFYSTNWPGQDYFSPQATAYFFHLVFLGILLTYFRPAEIPPLSTIKRWLFIKPLANGFYKFLVWVGPGLAGKNKLRPAQEVMLKVILFLTFGVIVAIHQLTPYITLVDVAALVIFQFCRLRRLPVLMVVMLAGWLFYMADPFIKSNGLVFKRHFLNFFANLDSNTVDISNATPGHAFISLAARGLTLILLILALGGIFRRLHHFHRDLPVVLLAGAAAPMFMVQDYGGEMIYRVYLFSLPWLVFLAAGLFIPGENHRHRPTWKAGGLGLLVSLLLLSGFITVYYGNEKMNNYSEAELTAAEYLYQTAPAGSILIKVNFSFPYKFTSDYNHYVEFAMVNDPNEIHQGYVITDALDIVNLVTEFKYPAGYVVFSRSQRDYAELSGVVSLAWVDQLEDELRQSSHFQLVYSNQDVQIFQMLKET